MNYQTPHLDPPAGFETREAPPHDQLRQGISQSVCCLCHKITDFGPNTLREKHDGAVCRTLAFGHLSYGPARSLLRAVAHHDGNLDQDMMKLNLIVQYYDSDYCGRDSYQYDVELTQNEWDQLVRGDSDLEGVGDDSQWVKALDELITRASDRAYYHVRNRLVEDYGEEAAIEEDASWGSEWAGTSVRCEEVEEEKRAAVDEIGKLMMDVELERPGRRVDEIERLLKRVEL